MKGRDHGNDETITTAAGEILSIWCICGEKARMALPSAHGPTVFRLDGLQSAPRRERGGEGGNCIRPAVNMKLGDGELGQRGLNTPENDSVDVR